MKINFVDKVIWLLMGFLFGKYIKISIKYLVTKCKRKQKYKFVSLPLPVDGVTVTRYIDADALTIRSIEEIGYDYDVIE